MPKIELDKLQWEGGSSYPSIYAKAVEGRSRKRMGDAGGLDQFGVNLARLEPGSASSQRHWHSSEDEFVFIVEGEVVLVEDEGENTLVAGDAAAFKAGTANGHHLINRSDELVLVLEIGTRAPTDEVAYPDIDMHGKSSEGTFVFTNKAGKPYKD